MSNERWLEFWRTHGRSTAIADEQTQVLRTLNKQPISMERWQATLNYVDGIFPVSSGDDFLDLCCGNGLFTAHFAKQCQSATAVDISPDLLATLDRRNLPNVTTCCKNICDVEFDDGAFSRILLYAGIQYLSEGEVVQLFRKMLRWLRPGGLIFIGDIPDRSRLWTFYNTPERRTLYFDNHINNQDVVGTWFDSTWLTCLAENVGFSQVEILQQPPEQIYAHFRFDMKVGR